MVYKQFVIEVDIKDWHVNKTFLGTESAAFCEGLDWMNSMILQYLKVNNIDDAEEAEKIAESACYSVTYDDDDFICMYAVYEEDSDEPVLGAFFSLADAEEAIFTECENYVEEILNFDDPKEVIGTFEWDIKEDYWWLMNDAAKTFSIQVIPAFGVIEDE